MSGTYMELVFHNFSLLQENVKRAHILNQKNNQKKDQKKKCMIVTVDGKYTRALTFQIFFSRRLFEVSKIKPGGFAEKSGM
jgi:hypothetical protein